MFIGIIIFVFVLIFVVIFITVDISSAHPHHLSINHYRNYPKLKQKSRNKVLCRKSLKKSCDFVIDSICLYKSQIKNQNAYLINDCKTNKVKWATCVAPGKPLRDYTFFVNKIVHQITEDFTIYIPMQILACMYEDFVYKTRKCKSVILVCNEGDEPCSKEMLKLFVQSSHIKKVYISNFELDQPLPLNSKIIMIPLGYQNNDTFSIWTGNYCIGVPASRTLSKVFYNNNNVINYTKNKRLIYQSFNKKQNKVLVAISLKTGSEYTSTTIRRECFNFFDKRPELAHVLKKKVDMDKYMKLHEEYAFEISPPGNGLDCYRHYECLLLKTIPIIFSSVKDPIFEGLPVLLINNIHEVTHQKLVKTKEKYRDWWENNNIYELLSVNKFFQEK